MAKRCYFPFLFLTYFFLSSALLARSDDGYVYSESESKYVRPNSNDEQKQELQNMQPGKSQDGVTTTVNNGPLSRPQSSLSVKEAEEGEGGRKSRVNRATSPAAEAAAKINKTRDGTAVVPPKDGTAVVAPKDGTAVVAPKDGTAVVPPKDGTAVVPPKDGTAVVAPKDGTAVVAPKVSMLQKSESSESLREKLGTMLTVFGLHPSRYISPMKELFHLYNSNIDIMKDDFSYGSISLHMQFQKHTNSNDIATVNTVFYANHTEDDTKSVGAQGDHLINLNVDELLRQNEGVNFLPRASFGDSDGIVTSDQSLNVYQSIKDSQLDATKLFITLDKVGEDRLSVSTLDNFLGECLKTAQDALAQPGASDKKKKKAENLQRAGEVRGSEASGSQTSGSEVSGSQGNNGQKKARKQEKTRKALMDEFKQSLVSKDMAACKKAAKLLMANSTISSLMYLFVLIALGVYLL
ncbi:hypothetical protein C922_00911 [Plasmodium inui San Antonio 1]|uniref:Uncharacterized protein n=1 Tax=Plasmodium inui San Antonio 1 TaxID=1237626 RepID=W7AA05_9APIC|nr:hypothetical protein C922_00911 [Plasmodium inui San Antonio 1]EUD68515.1 hypothetical protein C922_00911 [Plasmodium inui San Antonio 1]